MSKVDALKKAIETLPEEEYTELQHWFSQKDRQKWDMQIQADSHSGKLDFLIEEALDEKSKGKLRDL
jgi:hypothetical protein